MYVALCGNYLRKSPLAKVSLRILALGKAQNPFLAGALRAPAWFSLRIALRMLALGKAQTLIFCRRASRAGLDLAWRSPREGKGGRLTSAGGAQAWLTPVRIRN